ncbi:MAG: DUF2993 domain-containing protein [Cyanobacteria bacterium J06638_28]
MTEIITIILSTLFTLISPVGLVADQVAEGLIRERLYKADTLAVRIDNVPNFQLVGGRVDRIRFAGRGIYPIPELRIDTLDVETDPIDLNTDTLRSGKVGFDAPVQTAAHIILKTEDLNTLLRSPRVQERLDELRFNLPGTSEREANRYGLGNLQMEFRSGNRLRITADLQDRVLNEAVPAVVECGFAIVDGHQLRLIDPVIVVDNQPVPQQLLDSFVEGITPELTLKRFEPQQVIARVIKFELSPDALDVAIFIRVNPDSPFLAQE